jgi:DNA polymerase IV
MKKHTKKIVFIYIPHIFIEGEWLRRRWDKSSLCVLASGDAPASIILDITENLRALKVRKGMFLKNLRHLKNNINIITADYEYIKQINDIVIKYLKEYSIIVESSSFGEFYIDLTGTERLFGRAIDTCLKIISHLNETYGFNAAAGIGSNKLIAHLAAKISAGNSVYEICAPAESLFLGHAKIAYMPDVRPEVKAELSSGYNIRRVEDLLAFSESDLQAMFKADGSLLYSYSRNIAPCFLCAKEEGSVLTRTLVLSEAANDDALIRRRFFNLVLELCSDMRRENIFPVYFDLKIIYKDNYKYAKSKKIAILTFVDKRLYAVLLPYLDDALIRRTCVKKIVLTFSGFIPAVVQESLFGNDDRDISLCRVFDAIREKYGKKAIDYFC